jgi:hypothetical protein
MFSGDMTLSLVNHFAILFVTYMYVKLADTTLGIQLMLALLGV